MILSKILKCSSRTITDTKFSEIMYLCYLLLRDSRTLTGLELAGRPDPRSVMLFVAREGPAGIRVSLIVGHVTCGDTSVICGSCDLRVYTIRLSL